MGIHKANSAATTVSPSRREVLGGVLGLLGAAPWISPAARALASDGVRPHFAGRARSIILLGQLGAPSQLDLFDPKPLLRERDGEEMPESLVAGQPVDQLVDRRLVIAGSRFDFDRHGQCGTELSSLLPHLGRVVDRIAVVRSMHTDVINHGPAQTMLMTGHPRAGRPSLGAWLMHGLGAGGRDLPGFVTLESGDPGENPPATLWGSGFLPGATQGVPFLSGEDPVPFLADPDGLSAAERERRMLAVERLDRLNHRRAGDPMILDRGLAARLARRMQGSVPRLLDLKEESEETLGLYGAEAGVPSYGANCLLARRMVERGARVVQLLHGGWDHHQQLPRRIPGLCRETDQGSAALILDLERRGLLDETLVVWAGEFGRTPMRQGGRGGIDHGRDHHGKAFSIWMAGAGVRPGIVHGATDEFGYDIVEDPVHMHDLHATILHLMGIDHERLVFSHEGREFRLTDVAGRVVRELIA